VSERHNIMPEKKKPHSTAGLRTKGNPNVVTAAIMCSAALLRQIKGRSVGAEWHHSPNETPPESFRGGSNGRGLAKAPQETFFRKERASGRLARRKNWAKCDDTAINADGCRFAPRLWNRNI
jgi:hypothetical protein